jgi:hypothetical protein
MPRTVTVTSYSGGKVVGTHTEVLSDEFIAAVDALKEAYKGFPWCHCASKDDPERWTYFENEFEVSHGWKCLDCGNVVQVG